MTTGRATGVFFSALLALTLWPVLAPAQPPKAGVVINVHGLATVARPVLPQPAALKFKDDVFPQDRIDTRENSLIRLFLGGKSLVTVRELSVFTITEEPRRAAVDLQVGKLALQVAKSLLKPGESIEIRTPNAIVAVRGSLIVVEVRLIAGVPRTSVTALEVTLPVLVYPRANPAARIRLRPNHTVNISDVGAATMMTPVQEITTAKARDEAKTAEVPRSEEQRGKLPESLAKQIRDAGLKQAIESTSKSTELARPERSTERASEGGRTTESQKGREPSESGGLKESKPFESGGLKGTQPSGGSELKESKPLEGGGLKGSGRPDIRTLERDLPKGDKTQRK